MDVNHHFSSIIRELATSMLDRIMTSAEKETEDNPLLVFKTFQDKVAAEAKALDDAPEFVDMVAAASATCMRDAEKRAREATLAVLRKAWNVENCDVMLGKRIGERTGVAKLVAEAVKESKQTGGADEEEEEEDEEEEEEEEEEDAEEDEEGEEEDAE